MDTLRTRAIGEDILIYRGNAQAWQPNAVTVKLDEIPKLIDSLRQLHSAGVHDLTGHINGCGCMDCVVYYR